MSKSTAYLTEHGFLLIEQLISLFIVSILAILSTQLLLVYTHTASSSQDILLTDLDVIASQFQQDANYHVRLYAKNDATLALESAAGDTITYFIKNNNLIRQKNGTGNEILLYNCLDFSVHSLSEQQALVSISTPLISQHHIYLSTLYTPLE